MKQTGLPNGFEYPIRRKLLRDALAPFREAVKVSMSKISLSEPQGSRRREHTGDCYWVGTITARPFEDRWNFEVEISGIRVERAAQFHEELGEMIIADIVKFIVETNALPRTHPEFGARRRLSLGFELSRSRPSSRSFIHPR